MLHVRDVAAKMATPANPRNLFHAALPAFYIWMVGVLGFVKLNATDQMPNISAKHTQPAEK